MISTVEREIFARVIFHIFRESLSCKFVNITIQTHIRNTSMQNVKCLFECKFAKFYDVNFFRYTVLGAV